MKTDALDAGVLCQRLSRYVDGNKKELAVLRGWLLLRLEVFRPVLAVLDGQIAALTGELEKAASQELPAGLGKLTSVVVSREVCDWHRFKNRRQVSSYTGLCPGEYSSGGKRVCGWRTRDRHSQPRFRTRKLGLRVAYQALGAGQNMHGIYESAVGAFTSGKSSGETCLLGGWQEADYGAEAIFNGHHGRGVVSKKFSLVVCRSARRRDRKAAFHPKLFPTHKPKQASGYQTQRE